MDQFYHHNVNDITKNTFVPLSETYETLVFNKNQFKSANDVSILL